MWCDGLLFRRKSSWIQQEHVLVWPQSRYKKMIESISLIDIWFSWSTLLRRPFEPRSSVYELKLQGTTSEAAFGAAASLCQQSKVAFAQCPQVGGESIYRPIWATKHEHRPTVVAASVPEPEQKSARPTQMHLRAQLLLRKVGRPERALVLQVPLSRKVSLNYFCFCIFTQLSLINWDIQLQVRCKSKLSILQISI